MDNLDKIKRYIELTRLNLKPSSPYQMTLRDMKALLRIADEDTGKALAIAFSFGMAKGTRLARAEARKV